MGNALTSERLRSIPSIDSVLKSLKDIDLPRPELLHIIREQIELIRQTLGTDAPPPDFTTNTRRAVAARRLNSLHEVINATGIIIHTNFGRSPLAAEAIEAIRSAAENYTNLEFDLAAGKRGGRGEVVENNLAVLVNAPAATIVNNCAAALVLTLHHFAGKPPKNEVVISRGELVQIGGGFRIPEILEAAGATLREVGTTNRTTVDDYRRAIGPQTAMILKVHHSNFAMTGFVESATIAQLVPLARAANVPLVDDLGSGNIAALRNEPTVAQSIDAGTDLVLFSGDKLLGGPQAGIIVGATSMILALKTDPMFRALRCDKLILAAMKATVDLHLREQAHRLPIVEMMNLDVAELRRRADEIIGQLSSDQCILTVVESESRVGGGAAPEATIPSIALRITSPHAPNKLIDRLRGSPTPVIGYIKFDAVMLDLRTVFPRQDAHLIQAIRSAAE